MPADDPTLDDLLPLPPATFLLGTAISFSLASASRWIESAAPGGGQGSVPVAENIPVEFALAVSVVERYGDAK